MTCGQDFSKPLCTCFCDMIAKMCVLKWHLSMGPQGLKSSVAVRSIRFGLRFEIECIRMFRLQGNVYFIVNYIMLRGKKIDDNPIGRCSAIAHACSHFRLFFDYDKGFWKPPKPLPVMTPTVRFILTCIALCDTKITYTLYPCGNDETNSVHNRVCESVTTDFWRLKFNTRASRVVPLVKSQARP